MSVDKTVHQSGSLSGKKLTAGDRLPGDLTRKELIDRVIRVDHAGEYGAARIYDGQLAVLERSGDTENLRVIRRMADQEKRHLETFDKLVVERGARPTLLSPVWHVAGFALGAVTAAMGPSSAMACTVAVEEVIDEHYAKQISALGDDEKELRDTLTEFRRDEEEHRDTALAHGAEDAASYTPLTGAVKAGTRFAIWLSERL